MWQVEIDAINSGIDPDDFIEDPKEIILYTSPNLGDTYYPTYKTYNPGDPKLTEEIEKAIKDNIRFYVDGMPEVVCPQHKLIIDMFS